GCTCTDGATDGNGCNEGAGATTTSCVSSFGIRQIAHPTNTNAIIASAAAPNAGTGETLNNEPSLSHHDSRTTGPYSRSNDGAISFRNARRSSTANAHCSQLLR